MKKTILTAFICLLAILTNAQTDFSGSWKFINQESVSGNLYVNGSPNSILLTQNKDAVVFQTSTATQNGTDRVRTDTFALNGKQTERIGASGVATKRTISWTADKKGFVCVTEIYNAADKSKLDYTNTDTWMLDYDKLLLYRKSENFTNGEVWESNAWYEKQ